MPSNGWRLTVGRQHLPDALRKLRPGHLDIEAVVARERLDELKVVAVAAIPAAHRAAGERQVGMHHDALGIEELLRAEAVARRAGAGRVVEREELRLEGRHAVAADRACMAAGEDELRALRLIQEGETREAAGEPQCRLE